MSQCCLCILAFSVSRYLRYRTLHGSGKSTFAARTSHSLHRSASTPTPKPMQTTTSTTMAPQHNQDEHHEWTESYFEGALEWLELIDKLSRRTSLFEANLRNSLIGQTEAIFYSSEYVICFSPLLKTVDQNASSASTLPTR